MEDLIQPEHYSLRAFLLVLEKSICVPFSTTDKWKSEQLIRVLGQHESRGRVNAGKLVLLTPQSLSPGQSVISLKG